MIDFFHNYYNSTFLIKHKFLLKIKLPQVLRLAIEMFTNLIMPIYYKLDSKKRNNTKKIDFTVSLTSFPNRISRVYLVIESILRQTYIPNKIILWLSEEQFKSVDDLPKKLLDLQERGLEIRLTPGDLRSYKKFYFLLKENKNSAFIIIDDDIFYPSNVIENLVITNQKYPTAICANRCCIIKYPIPYIEWDLIEGETSKPRFDLLPTGCGGVLYPANSLHLDVLEKELFTSICKDADDIWLNCAAFLNKTPTVYSGKNEYLLAVNSLNNSHLYSNNVEESNNDIQIKKVVEHYQSVRSINVFNR
tara:strand:- start:10815 stop:11729 length:915 start_codon:yes stop_codon:yes gene_type:complete